MNAVSKTLRRNRDRSVRTAVAERCMNPRHIPLGAHEWISKNRIWGRCCGHPRCTAMHKESGAGDRTDLCPSSKENRRLYARHWNATDEQVAKRRERESRRPSKRRRLEAAAAWAYEHGYVDP